MIVVTGCGLHARVVRCVCDVRALLYGIVRMFVVGGVL